MADFELYQSPFTWRYGSREMRQLWSEIEKRKHWRRVWLTLAEVQNEFGLVTADQLEDLRKNVDRVDLTAALELESQIHHDLMAELRVFAAQSQLGGKVLHLGATSMDIEDNADGLRILTAISIIEQRLASLLLEMARRIQDWSDYPVIAFTHLQPAEITTLGYRFAFYAQDLFDDWEKINQLKKQIRGKGFKGAVGAASSYIDLIGASQFPVFEERLSAKLGLKFYSVTGQVYPRKQDYEILCTLAGIAANLYKMAFDIRVLQMPVVGELSEGFEAHQVGSSAMPFKRNPIQAEKIDSLARALAQLPLLAWHNAAHSLLERTLDDSANRRFLLPEAFLNLDELLITSIRIIKKIEVRDQAVKKNLEEFGPFAATEPLLMELVKKGADRQIAHENLRRHSMMAWRALQSGEHHKLVELISSDDFFLQYLSSEKISETMNIEHYTGIAPQRAKQMAETIFKALENEDF